MRNLILAFIGCLFLTMATGCGAIKTIATDTCSNGHYNHIVCPGILEEALPEAPVKAPVKAAPCVGTATRTNEGTTVSTFGSIKTKMCKQLHLKLKIESLNRKAGTTCTIEEDRVVVCAGFHHAGGLLLILLTLLWGRGLCDLMVASVKNEGTHRPFHGMWAACRTMIIAIVGIVIILAAGGAYAAPKSAHHGGCSVSKNESIIELFQNSCSVEVLESLIEELGLVCTEGHRMEGVSLSMAAPTEQGLSEEADLRHRFLEALCWSEAGQAGFGWACIYMFILGLFRRKTTTYSNETQILKNRTVRINKKELVVDCVLVIKTYRDNSQTGHDGRHKIIGHHFMAVSQDGAWERQGYHGDFVPYCD